MSNCIKGDAACQACNGPWSLLLCTMVKRVGLPNHREKRNRLHAVRETNEQRRGCVCPIRQLCNAYTTTGLCFWKKGNRKKPSTTASRQKSQNCTTLAGVRLRGKEWKRSHRASPLYGGVGGRKFHEQLTWAHLRIVVFSRGNS